MKKVQFTVLQLAEAANSTREAAYGFCQFMIDTGMVTTAGTVPKAPGAKGRGQIIYQMNLDDTRVKMYSLFEALQNKFEVESAVNDPPAPSNDNNTATTTTVE